MKPNRNLAMLTAGLLCLAHWSCQSSKKEEVKSHVYEIMDRDGLIMQVEPDTASLYVPVWKIELE